MDDIFTTPPLSINELGVKFWLDKKNTTYVRQKGLKNVVIFFVEKADGCRTRLITQNGHAVFDSQNLEDIECHINIMFMNSDMK